MIERRLIPEWATWYMSGGQLSRHAAATWEQRLHIDGSDREARGTLLGYYSKAQLKSKSAGRRRIDQILWILEHAPDCRLGRTPYLRISRKLHPDDYETAKAIILRQCEKFANSPPVLTDLGAVLMHEEPELAVPIFKEAYSKSEKKSHIAFWIATTLHELGTRTNSLDNLNEAVAFMQEVVTEQRLEPDTQRRRRFDFRFWLAKYAFDSRQIDLASATCKEILSDDAPDDQGVHVAHMVLGSIAFQEKDLAAAAKHLLDSAKVSTSPRLCSYGPIMSLAQQLLEDGEREIVLQYLDDCKRFWGTGKRDLAKWIREIKRGETPILKGDQL